SYVKTDVPIPPDQINIGVLHMNMGREHMKDPRVRQALALAMNLDAPFRTFYYNKFSVQDSVGFESPLAPKGSPSAEVREILGGSNMESLKPYEDIGFQAVAKVKGKRERLGQAARLLREAGYHVENTVLVKDGKPVELTVLLWTQSRGRNLILS